LRIFFFFFIIYGNLLVNRENQSDCKRGGKNSGAAAFINLIMEELWQ